MLSKHASLSMQWLSPYSNTDCANPSVFFQADLFVYTVCNRFGVLRYRDISPPFFVPSELIWDICCPLYIFCMRSVTEARFVTVSFQPHVGLQPLSGRNFCRLKWVLLCVNRGLFYFLDDFLEAWRLCMQGKKKRFACAPEEIDATWEQRTLDILMILWRLEAEQKVMVHSFGWTLFFLHFTFC